MVAFYKLTSYKVLRALEAASCTGYGGRLACGRLAAIDTWHHISPTAHISAARCLLIRRVLSTLFGIGVCPIRTVQGGPSLCFYPRSGGASDIGEGARGGVNFFGSCSSNVKSLIKSESVSLEIWSLDEPSEQYRPCCGLLCQSFVPLGVDCLALLVSGTDVAAPLRASELGEV